MRAFLSLVLAAVLLGCTTSYKVVVVQKTLSPNETKFLLASNVKGQSQVNGGEYRLSLGEFYENDIRASGGVLTCPTVALIKTGYKPFCWSPGPFTIDQLKMLSFRPKNWVTEDTPKVEGFNTRYTVFVSPPETIVMEKDPAYEGKDGGNKAVMTVNSEPSGARVYANGQLMGTTPCSLTYDISKENYKSKTLRSVPLTLAHDQCFSKQTEYTLQIDPDCKYEDGKTYTYNHLVILDRDPNYKTPIVNNYNSYNQTPSYSQNPSTINVRQEKDTMDKVEQGARTYNEIGQAILLRRVLIGQ